jgi:hypothetical protein
MKRISIVVLFLVMVGVASAEIERTLIDFGVYEQKQAQYLDKEKQNLQNLVDSYKQKGI